VKELMEGFVDFRVLPDGGKVDIQGAIGVVANSHDKPVEVVAKLITSRFD
jgi:hypothetical protein